MEYQDVALIDSHYTLMLFCLLYPDKVGKTLFIVSDGVSESVRKNLENCIYLADTKYCRLRKTREILRNIKYIVTPKFRQLRKSSNIHFYGQDHAWFSFIGKNKPFTLLEDGLDNYVRAPSTGIKRKLLSYFGTPYLEMGRSDNVYQIQLTGILPIPEDIKNKVNIVDIKNQWEGLGQEIKKFISHLFMNKVQLGKIANLECKDSALIITQPLNQDGIISVEQKINYYLDAVSGVEGVKEVWFKRHPRDDTNYDNLGWKELGFADCPIELLSQLGLEFKYIITYNSTAIYRFPKEKRITAVLK